MDTKCFAVQSTTRKSVAKSFRQKIRVGYFEQKTFTLNSIDNFEWLFNKRSKRSYFENDTKPSMWRGWKICAFSHHINVFARQQTQTRMDFLKFLYVNYLKK